MTRACDLLGTAAFLVGLGPQLVAGACFVLARKLWRLA